MVFVNRSTESASKDPLQGAAVARPGKGIAVESLVSHDFVVSIRVTIIEEKVYKKYATLSEPLKNKLKHYFFDFLEDKALELIAKKVSQANGDIRIAFDLMKGTLQKLQTIVLSARQPIMMEELFLSYQRVLEVFEEKFGSKLE